MTSNNETGRRPRPRPPVINKAIGWGLTIGQDPLEHLRGKRSPTLGDHSRWLEELGTEEALDAMPSGLGTKVIPVSGHAPYILQQPFPVLLFVPPARGWMRRDDSLDYGFADTRETSIEVLYANPPGPFEDMWMYRKNGELLNSAASDFRAACGARTGSVPELDRLAVQVRVEGQGKPLFTGAHDAFSDVVPYVPNEVRWLAEHLDVFEDKTSVLRCRPIRAQWWS